jgi:hypothetical protein
MTDSNETSIPTDLLLALEILIEVNPTQIRAALDSAYCAGRMDGLVRMSRVVSNDQYSGTMITDIYQLVEDAAKGNGGAA